MNIGKTQKNGFTLIELLVVILIIMVLGAIGAASYSNAMKSARNAKRRSDLETIRQALILKRQESTTGCYVDTVSATTLAGYLNTVPTDPQGGNYTYTPSPGTGCKTSFILSAPKAEPPPITVSSP
jgi:prepilin-type N-terminal cleavage/methylation domain-containing protein